ncbi:MAG: hypothetical protein IT426_15790 [Pirellulales bacterium]|nr:hypothetical protein [Pirellulales bacterium]
MHSLLSTAFAMHEPAEEQGGNFLPKIFGSGAGSRKSGKTSLSFFDANLDFFSAIQAFYLIDWHFDFAANTEIGQSLHEGGLLHAGVLFELHGFLLLEELDPIRRKHVIRAAQFRLSLRDIYDGNCIGILPNPL